MAVNTTTQLSHSDCAIEGIVATFAAICGEEPECQVTEVGSPGREAVSGIISIVGDVAWSLILSLPPETATRMAMTFAGFEIPFESKDMLDVVGELANVAAGDIVQRLECQGVKAQLSIPTVTRGRDVETLCPGSKSARTVRFTTGEGSFWLEVCAA